MYTWSLAPDCHGCTLVSWSSDEDVWSLCRCSWHSDPAVVEQGRFLWLLLQCPNEKVRKSDIVKYICLLAGCPGTSFSQHNGNAVWKDCVISYNYLLSLAHPKQIWQFFTQIYNFYNSKISTANIQTFSPHNLYFSIISVDKLTCNKCKSWLYGKMLQIIQFLHDRKSWRSRS